jgi:hypothetical protein
LLFGVIQIVINTCLQSSKIWETPRFFWETSGVFWETNEWLGKHAPDFWETFALILASYSAFGTGRICTKN